MLPPDELQSMCNKKLNNKEIRESISWPIYLLVRDKTYVNSLCERKQFISTIQVDMDGWEMGIEREKSAAT